MGLMVWVGIWDLIDEILVPSVTTACTTAPPAEVQHSNRSTSGLKNGPGCAGIKLMLFALGVIGLWATRSLYGHRLGPAPPQFQRAEHFAVWGEESY